MKKSDKFSFPLLVDKPQSRMAKAFGRNRYLWYAFLFPFLLTIIAYLTRGIFPIMNRCILTIDLYHQYAPFLSELREKLTGFDSLLYTWNAGLGLNFLALSAYYLISPFNLILLLLPRANLPEAIAVIQVVKIGLCSLGMAYYLRKRFGREGIGLALFGTFYAMSAYVLAYSWNIMWLDGILMLPIVALGLEEMIAGRRFLRYTIALALTITFCYYIAYFVCLFLVIYFFIAFFSRHQALQFGLLLRKGLKFAFFSALAGGMSAIIVLPTYTALQLTSAASDSFPSAWKLTFNLFDFLTNHLMVVPLHIRDGLPNIYSGLSLLILLPLYFFSPTISIRAKIAHIFGLLALYFSFNVNALDFIWNGMHYPNQLPYRYAFVYIFLLLSMGYPVFLRLREFPSRLILGIGMAAAAYVFIAEKLGSASIDPLTVYLSVVFLAFLVAAFVYAKDFSRPRELRVTVLASVIIAEILVNTFITVDLMDSTEYYSDRGGFVEDRVRLIDLMNRVEDDGTGDFYRVEILEPRTVNDTILHSYRGISIFASTAYLKTTRVMRALGLHNNAINSYRYSDSTPVLESILGIRYLVSKDAAYSRPTMEPYFTEGEYSVFRNPYALPIAYMAGQSMDNWRMYNNNPFETQNQFLELACGIQNVQLPLKTSVLTQSNMTIQENSTASEYSYTKPGQGTCSAEFTFEVPISREVSFFLDANQLENTTVSLNADETTRKTYDLKRSFIVDLGFLDAGTVVHVQMTFKDAPSGTIKLYAASLDDVRFKQAMTALSEQGLHVDRFSDTSLEGDISVRTDGTLFTSIPYDAGWTVKVNGAEVETFALAEGLLAVKMTAGTHRVEMRYLPPKLTEGALISAASLLLFVAVTFVLQSIYKKRLPEPLLADSWPPLPEWSENEVTEDRYSDYNDPLGSETDEDDLNETGWHATASYRSFRSAAPDGHISAAQEHIRHVILPPQLPLSPAEAPSGRDRGDDESLEQGIGEDLPEQQGDQEQENGKTEQDQQGEDGSL